MVVLRLEDREVPGEVFLAKGNLSTKYKGLRKELAQITQGTKGRQMPRLQCVWGER